MTDERARGQQIQTRLDRMGISAREFAGESGIDRTTLKRVIDGEGRVRAATYGAIEATLDRLEEEMGIGAPSAQGSDLIEFRVEGLYGAKAVIVKGPVKDKEALLEVVERLMRGQSGDEDA